MNKPKNYITRQGFEKLRQELEHLIKVERPEVTKTVTWAASLGDRSENADYIYGKKRLREIDSRIRFLNKRLDIAEVVPLVANENPKIQFGATVVIENEDGEQKKYKIVGEDETKPEQGMISWKSPIGSCLLGKEAGDEVVVKTPRGNSNYEIISVTYQVVQGVE